MKITFNKIFFSVFILLWFAAVLINILTPFRSYSENENRYFSKIPEYSFDTLINGEFMNKVNDYVNDQFIARDNWISAQSMLEYFIGKRESNNVFICKDSLIGKIDGPNEEYIKDNIAGIYDFITATETPASLMIIPGASEILSHKLPSFARVWDQKEKIDEIYNSINFAKCISVYETLSDHKDEYIYYRTDHHWTTYGAYLAYTDYCNACGLSPAEYAADKISKSFNGTLYSSSGVRFINSDTIEAFIVGSDAYCDIFDGNNTQRYDSIYFPDYLNKKDKYAYFLGTNQPVVTVYGDNVNGPRLILFKDSYAHCMAPMLLEHYSQITLVDLRYINRQFDYYFDVNDYDEALFLYSIDTFGNQNDISKLSTYKNAD